METINKREAWNKGKLVGQKPPLKPKDIWAIRIYLQNSHAVRDLAMFNLAIDSKLRGCDLVSLRVRDITHGNQVLSRAMVIQRKTQRPVQFELTEPTRSAVSAWLEKSRLRSDQFLFPSRVAKSPHVSTRQYARIVHHWAESAGLDSSAYGTHSMRRTKATLIYKRTKNLRAVQLLLGHSNWKVRSDTSASRWMTRWKFRNRLKSSQGLRLRVLITRAAAFGHPLVLVLSARSGQLASKPARSAICTTADIHKECLLSAKAGIEVVKAAPGQSMKARRSPQKPCHSPSVRQSSSSVRYAWPSRLPRLAHP